LPRHPAAAYLFLGRPLFRFVILYKYFPPERRTVISAPQVRFTPPFAFNDVFECFPALDKVSAFLWLMGQSLPHQLSAVVVPTPSISSAVGSALTSVHFRQLHTSPQALQRKLKHPQSGAIAAELGIFCLSAVPNNQLMWAHYSASHQGFAIGFDSDHPFFRDGTPELALPPVSPVRYSDTRPTITLLIRCST
jgi:Protein of unknown function (DUF2971)